MLPDVITSFELEAMLRNGKLETRAGERPRYVSIIHCVGSRSEEFHRYCSRVCCMSALKYGHQIRAALPGAHVTDVYTDMNAFGKGCEELYRKSAEARTLFLMFDKHAPPTVTAASPEDDFGMLVSFREQLSGEDVEMPADLVVLMVAMEPREDSEHVAHVANISRDREGWFTESHPSSIRWRPRRTACSSRARARPRRTSRRRLPVPRCGGAHPRQDLAGCDRSGRGLLRGGREAVRGVPQVQLALPVQRHHLRRGEEAERDHQRCMQGVRLLHRRVPERCHPDPAVQRPADVRADRGGALTQELLDRPGELPTVQASLAVAVRAVSADSTAAYGFHGRSVQPRSC